MQLGRIVEQMLLEQTFERYATTEERQAWAQSPAGKADATRRRKERERRQARMGRTWGEYENDPSDLRWTVIEDALHRDRVLDQAATGDVFAVNME